MILFERINEDNNNTDGRVNSQLTSDKAEANQNGDNMIMSDPKNGFENPASHSIPKPANAIGSAANNQPPQQQANVPQPQVNGPYNRAVGEAVMTQQFKDAISEHMDITDYKTITRLYNLDEAEQNTALLSLTNRLYQMIVNKIDTFDKGDIARTRGNIRKLPKYNDLCECVGVLMGIFEKYHEDTKPVQEISNAISNIENLDDVFTQSYMAKVDFGQVMYETMTLACISSVSYMIAACIEYVKDPKKDGLTIVLDKTGVSKVKEHLLYENICKFNTACKTGDIENALRPLIKARARNFVGALGFIKAAAIAIPLVLALIPMIKDVVYYFFAARQRVSVYFDIQGDLLEMNAHELEENPDIQTDGDRKTVIRKQIAIANSFHKIADKLAVEAKTAENKATTEIKKDDKKQKIDDIDTDPSSSDGPLF